MVFDRPSQEVFDKWQIAPEGEVAHIITMPHVDCQTIDQLVADCSSPRLEPPPEHDLPPAETGLPAQEQQVEVKRLLAADPHSVLDMVFAFQDRIGLVRPLNAAV